MRKTLSSLPERFDGSPSSRALHRLYVVAATFCLLAMVACGGGWGERPEVVHGPANQTVIAGQTATFNVSANGTAPLTYQWSEGGVALSGATGASYTTAATTGQENGSVFSVTVMNAAGDVSSASAILTVEVPPAVIMPPVNQTVIAGQTATFISKVTGTGPMGYQWLRDGVAIAGATGAAYTTPVTAGSDTGAMFSVVVTNAAGTVTTTIATLTVNVPPSITVQPVSDRVDAGATATFRVSATGTAPMSYQWYRSGVSIPGATASSYTTAATAGSDNGSVFTATATNIAGTATSAAATLHVNVGPTITVQPLSQTIVAGQTATLSVAATGSNPMTYQWYVNGAPITGATSNFYTTPVLSGTESGALYTVTVVNVAGTTTSIAAALTVNVPPTITLQPVSRTVVAGNVATFSVAATGTTPLSYQWYRGGGAIPGATSSVYTAAATVSGDSGATFTVSVTNVAGTATSAASVLTVNVPPVITVQPVSQTVVEGQPAVFSVTATGTAPLIYQWYRGGVAITGATSRYYRTGTTVSGDSGSAYSVTVTNVAGSASSAVAALTINTPPAITSQPVSQTVTSGSPATFSVAANGTAPLTYQWYLNGVAIGGATSSSYTTAATVSDDSGELYTATVTNVAGSASSAAAALTVDSAPTIVAQPVSQTVTAPQTATFSVVATGTATLTYQWYLNGSPIGGAIASSYTTAATAAANNGSVYTVKVTNATGSVTSSAATLNVDTTPLANGLNCSASAPPYNASITLVPNFSGGTGTIGTAGPGSANLAATAVSGTTYTSAALTSATTFTLTVNGSNGVTAATSCTATPTAVTMTPITPSAQTVAPGAITFGTTVAGGATNKVIWTATGGSFSGDVWTAPNTPGTYTITATSVDNPAVHQTTTITVSAPVLTVEPVSKNVCSSSTINQSLSVSAAYASSYQWFDGVNPVGTNSPLLTFSPVSSANNGNYSCTVTNGAGSVTSNVVTLNVVNPTTLAITSQPMSASVYATQTATFSIAASGTGALAYQWYTGQVGSGTAISGATSSTYTTGALTIANNATSYYVTVTDTNCTDTTVTSTAATLTVTDTDTAVPPTIVVQPVGETATVGGTTPFSVTASGPGPLTYQWYRVPYSSTELSNPSAGSAVAGATAATYTVPASETAQSNDGDSYYVVVTNDNGSAKSSRAVLAVGAGILLQITAEPQTVYIADDTLASFTVGATCTGCIPAYQWYWYAPGSTTVNALVNGAVANGTLSGATVTGATTSSLTLENVPFTASSAIFYVVVTSTSDGSTTISGTNPLTSSTAALFVGSLGTVGNTTAGDGLCNNSTSGINWVLNGTNPGTSSGRVPYQNTSACTIELTDDNGNEHAAVYWPTLISTANFSVSFTVAMTASGTPADGFTMVLADPSQGATTASLGTTGEGLGANGIPGFVLGFDTFQNSNGQGDPGCIYNNQGTNEPCDPVAVPYMAVGQGASSLWENPWTFVNGDLNTQSSTDYSASTFANSTHSYVVTVVKSIMTVTMDGHELFTGNVTLPPAAYLGFTASTGGSEEAVTFSNLTATVSAP